MDILKRWVSAQYLDGRRIAALRRQFIAAQPFPHIALAGFLRPAKLRMLGAAVRKQEFSRKEADLFSFSQSPDLHAADDAVISEFLTLLKSEEFTTLIGTITATETKPGKVDASAFIYGDTDHLLCHDDGVPGRRVAYIMNLSTLSARQGGALSLFASDNKGRPAKIVKRIRPQQNTFVLFKVTGRSHHQVNEVLGAKRITVAGWFHA